VANNTDANATLTSFVIFGAVGYEGIAAAVYLIGILFLVTGIVNLFNVRPIKCCIVTSVVLNWLLLLFSVGLIIGTAMISDETTSFRRFQLVAYFYVAVACMIAILGVLFSMKLNIKTEGMECCGKERVRVETI